MTIHSFKPDLPPPTISIGALGWLRANLFSSWINTLLTLVGLYLLWLIVPPVLVTVAVPPSPPWPPVAPPVDHTSPVWPAPPPMRGCRT